MNLSSLFAFLRPPARRAHVEDAAPKPRSRRARAIILALAAILTLALMLYASWENAALVRTDYQLGFSSLPAALHGFRIVQVSDLHGAIFGTGNERLLAMTRDADPDMIAITGDLISEVDAFTEEYLDRTVGGLVAIAPVYYVPGNNEVAISGYQQFKIRLEGLGVTVLDDRWIQVGSGEASFLLAGMDDPQGHKTSGTTYIRDRLDAINGQLDLPEGGTRPFTVLLAHRPEFFEQYAAAGFDLVLSGHTHGGQVRIPGIGGLYAPNQGLFPRFDAGLYETDASKMIISRGLGNSGVAQRLNDKPELVTVTLLKTDEAPQP